MNITFFILFLFILQVICLIVGGKSSKGMKNQEDYFLAGKGIRFFPLMMTFLATQVGGGLILGSAEEAYKYGWSVLFYPLGAVLGLIFLGTGFGRKLASFPVSTVAQIFEVAYGSANLKKIASVLSIVSLFMIFVAQIIASHKFMVSLGVNNEIWFLGFWAIVILYTAVGGLKAVVATDIIQAAFFGVIFFLSLGYVWWTGDFQVQPLLDFSSNSQDFSFDPSKIYGWLFMPLLFMLIEQDMGQRCFAADSPKTISKATIWAGVLTMLISMIPVIFGIMGKSLGIEVAPGSSVFMTVIEKTTTPALTALVGCAILTAIISTADSLINAIGSNLSQDFNWALLSKDRLRPSQMMSAGIAIVGVFCSYYFNNVVDMLIQSYELSVSCLFVPIFIILFKKKGNKVSAIFSIAFGAIGFVLFKFVDVSLPKELLSVLLSFMGYYIGEAVALRKEPVLKKTLG